MRAFLSQLFNWKRHPKAVFLWAIPLFSIGIMLALARAYLEVRLHHDYSYVIIVNVLLFLGLMSIRPILKRL